MEKPEIKKQQQAPISFNQGQVHLVKKGFFYYLFLAIKIVVIFIYKLIQFSILHTIKFFRDMVNSIVSTHRGNKFETKINQDNEIL